MDPVSVGQVISVPGWAIAISLLLAGVTIIVYLGLSARLARSTPASAPHQHQALEATTQPSQQCLSQINPDKSEMDTDIDIIAIHGLDTKSPDTWTWKNTRDPKNEAKWANWLQDTDMLPNKVERVRIFTCDWPADLLQKSIPTTLQESARVLLDNINRHLTANTTKDRPILFVASCLGGIILIKALEIDRSGHGSDSPHLRRATRGIVFLATPFGGTAFKNMPDLVLKAWASLRDQTVTALIDYAKEPTSELDELVCKFIQLQQAGGYHVYTFWEGNPTTLLRKIYLAWMFSKGMLLAWLVVLTSTWLLGLFSPWLLVLFFPWLMGLSSWQPKQLVDESSASALVFERQRLNRSHVLMNKFSHSRCKDHCPECGDYESVAGKIQDILGKIRAGSPLKQADAWIRDNHYTTERLKIERLSGEQLSMDQCYINLAIVEQPGRDAARPDEGSDRDTPPQSSPFSLSARLKIETPDKNIRVELPTLFNPRKGRDGHTTQPRRILIRGRAGVGKTTLCKKMIHDHIHHRTWEDLFDRILWVPLRALKRKPDRGYNLEGLFLRDFFSGTPDRESFAKELEKALHATELGRTLFVLDGLDEVSEGLDTDSEMCEFLELLLNQPNVIITSRPSATLPDHLRPDLELETIGFYPDQVTEYTKKALRDPHKLPEVQSFLQRRPLIHGLVRIPIQLDALCFTWDDLNDKDERLQTMTSLYRNIELKLWRKDVLRLEKAQTKSHFKTASRATIEYLVKDEISFLERLAFAGLHNDTIDYGSDHRNAIADRFVPPLSLDKTLPRLSFLRTSDRSAKHSDQNCHFLHLTFQEYFAARYFVRRWTGGKGKGDNDIGTWLELQDGRGAPVNTVSYLQEHKYNARYDIFWRFVTGLLHANPDKEQLCRFFRTIEDEPRDLLGPVHQRLVMHCLSEVPSEETEFKQLRERLEDQLKQWLLFECRFSEHSQLAAEMEFPEKILGDVLKEASKDVEKKILHSLKAKPSISPAIIQAVAASLKDPESNVRSAAVKALGQRPDLPEAILQAVAASLKDPDSDVRFAAAGALGRRPDLPEAILQAVAASLKHPDSDVRYAAAEALGQRPDLPEAILQAVAASLKDPNSRVRYAAVEALGRRPDLPEAILQAVAASLKDPNSRVRYAAVEALGRRSNYFFLPTLDSESFNNFYGFLLRRSFSNYLTWCVEGNNSSINMPEGGRDVPFDQLESKVQEAQASLKVPL
ncbi:hypothetical protein RB600_007056 [Gaeumannomyces tritici]